MSHLEDGTQLLNVSQHGRVCMYQIGNQDSNGVRVLAHVDGKPIDQNGDDGSPSRACQNQIDKLVRKGCVLANLLEDLAAVQECVSQHAHVFLTSAPMDECIRKSKHRLSANKKRE